MACCGFTWPSIARLAATTPLPISLGAEARPDETGTGKTQSAQWDALINGNRLENCAHFWGIFGSESHAEERDRTYQRSLARSSRRLTGSTVGVRSFRSQA